MREALKWRLPFLIAVERCGALLEEGSPSGQWSSEVGSWVFAVAMKGSSLRSRK